MDLSAGFGDLHATDSGDVVGAFDAPFPTATLEETYPTKGVGSFVVEDPESFAIPEPIPLWSLDTFPEVRKRRETEHRLLKGGKQTTRLPMVVKANTRERLLGAGNYRECQNNDDCS